MLQGYVQKLAAVILLISFNSYSAGSNGVQEADVNFEALQNWNSTDLGGETQIPLGNPIVATVKVAPPGTTWNNLNLYDQGIQLEQQYGFDLLSVPYQTNVTGFPTANGPVLDAQGAILKNYFKLHLTSSLGLSPGAQEGLYEFVALVDDGVRLKVAGVTYLEHTALFAGKIVCNPSLLFYISPEEQIDLEVDYFQGSTKNLGLSIAWRAYTGQPAHPYCNALPSNVYTVSYEHYRNTLDSYEHYRNTLDSYKTTESLQMTEHLPTSIFTTTSVFSSRTLMKNAIPNTSVILANLAQAGFNVLTTENYQSSPGPVMQHPNGMNQQMFRAEGGISSIDGGGGGSSRIVTKAEADAMLNSQPKQRALTK